MRYQRGFGITLILYGLIALAILGALGGIYAKGYFSGQAAKQVEWDEANRLAQEKADEERRQREVISRDAAKRLQSAEARATDADARWRAAKAKSGPLAACEPVPDRGVPETAAAAPSGAPRAPSEALGGAPAASQPAPDGGMRLRFTAEFVGLWDRAWTGEDGQPVFSGAREPAEAAAAALTVGRLLEAHAENASRCSANARQLTELIALIRKLQAR
jgi:hypothetical protein